MIPILEPAFVFHGREYVAHCVPDEFDMGALEVCLYEVRGGFTRFIAWGAFGKRLVSPVLTTGLRKAAEAAIAQGQS